MATDLNQAPGTFLCCVFWLNQSHTPYSIHYLQSSKVKLTLFPRKMPYLCGTGTFGTVGTACPPQGLLALHRDACPACQLLALHVLHAAGPAYIGCGLALPIN